MKLKYILCMAAFAGAFTACDVTDKSPIDSLTDASYWRTVQDLKLYANGLYGNLDAPSVTKDNTSDNCVTTSYSSWLFNESNVPATAGSAGWTWGNIRTCNFFLQRYETVSGTESEINQYVAEVRFSAHWTTLAKSKRSGMCLGMKRIYRRQTRTNYIKHVTPRILFWVKS